MRKANDETYEEMRNIKNCFQFMEKINKQNNANEMEIDKKDPKVIQRTVNKFMEEKLEIKINNKSAYNLVANVVYLTNTS